MGAHKGAVHHRVFVVGIARQATEETRPNPALGPATEPRMHNPEISIARWQIPPRNPSPVAIQNCVHKQAIVLRGDADIPRFARPHILDLCPLTVRQSIPAHHPSGLLLPDSP